MSDDEWRRAQEILPIACVDVLPIQVKKRTGHDSIPEIEKVFLIWRNTPHQGTRWCLIGGRMFHGFSLGKSVEDQLKVTLNVSIPVPPTEQPTYVAQYRPFPGEGFHVDPRRHAVGYTYCLKVDEKQFKPVPKEELKNIEYEGIKSEARDYEWFRLDQLPQPHEFGFGQHLVVNACLERWSEQARMRSQLPDQRT